MHCCIHLVTQQSNFHPCTLIVTNFLTWFIQFIMQACSTTPKKLCRDQNIKHIISKCYKKSEKNVQINCCLQTYKHKLGDGVQLEVLKRIKNSDQNKPPLIFLHGSSHAAWCFEENFLPYFSELGYPSYALSFRGQGGSDPVDGPVAGTVQDHVDDLAHFIKSLKYNQEEQLDPVILAHSFGGYIAELYVSEKDNKGYPEISGVALMCVVPPSGNSEMVKRYMRRDLWLSFKVTWAFIRKSYASSLEECKYVFFSDDIADDKLKRYFEKLQECKKWVRLIDLSDLRKRDPLIQPEKVPPAFVLGAVQDKIVDKEGVEETAKWLDVQPVFIDQMNHDCMLDTRWQEAAVSVQRWLEGLK
eukprot:TRINITY_DN42325_c0_g1_i2.p1 TRINITY_DN42325_c0_g1~~TRINITY_DN42325_c0_g1_i2.p1  ORF type:complete len:358 (-),score=44.81 TRINITY_DN42325_c0_g1_i2:205-1278(-)